MWPVSSRFTTAVSGSHQAQVRVEVWSQGVQLAADAPILGGEVTDTLLTAGIRRSLSLTVPASEFWRRMAKIPNLEIRPFRGMDFGGGDVELCPLGRFLTWPPDQALDSTAPLTIKGDDYWTKVVDDDFLEPTLSYPGSVRDVVAQLITEIGVPYPTGTATSTAPMRTHLWDKTRHDAIAAGVTAVGAEAWFDRVGRAVVRDRDLSMSSTGVVRVGVGGTLVELVEKVNWAAVVNVIAVSSSATDVVFAPAVASITDPAHPAHQSKIGRHQTKYSSPLLADRAQAQVVANRKLTSLSSPARSLNIQTIPNPSRDAGDVITVQWVGSSELARIQQVVTPLQANGLQQITTIAADVVFGGDEIGVDPVTGFWDCNAVVDNYFSCDAVLAGFASCAGLATNTPGA